ncbi:MAG: serine/threonine protein kinase [Vulcanimicrobiota bacterium]
MDVLFKTSPSGASVYHVTSDPVPQLLGPSGRVFAMTRPRGQSFRVVIKKWGYQDAPAMVTLARRGEGYEWPAGEPFRLTPVNPLIPLLTPVPLTLLGFLLGGGVWGLSVRSKARREAQKVVDFESRIVPSNDDQVGKHIGNYLLLERLGRGGMATVYRVTPVDRPQDEYALKLLHDDSGEDGEFMDRFRREVKICRELQHPNIVNLYDFDSFNGRYFMVMELVEGQTLREEIDGRKLEPATVLALLKPIVEGVAFAHSRGIVHRDLKPENVLVTPEQSIKVADFGLARKNDSTTITRTGSIFGTPAYMAPEQVTGAGTSPASDQYALGIMTFEMLAGEPPFYSPENAIETVMKHVSEEPPPLSNWRPELPAEVDGVLRKMLAKTPPERFDDLQEAFAALRRALG